MNIKSFSFYSELAGNGINWTYMCKLTSKPLGYIVPLGTCCVDPWAEDGQVSYSCGVRTAPADVSVVQPSSAQHTGCRIAWGLQGAEMQAVTFQHIV